ncbi:MAG: DUF4115 domain-containing protein [Opitutus sp.]|nr:DUF4115 domain-containing protein [Opitutus sp.]
MQTIGERLEEARKKKGISIREAAEATKMRGDYLQKFESNQFDIGLTALYTRGFLRNYANFLKLPADRIISDFAGLGHGEVRPRQPNREIYGRLDISVASADEATDRAAPPPEEAAEPASVGRGISQPRYPRGSTSLPAGPDPAVVFKYIKWSTVVVVVFIVLWLIKSLFTTSGTNSAGSRQLTQPAPAPAAVSDQSVTLVALDAVFVTVVRRNSDDTDGEEIFKGTLSRNQRQVVPKTGPIYITASAAENLLLEIKGKSYPLEYNGARYQGFKKVALQ